jgi:hypothetical protein
MTMPALTACRDCGFWEEQKELVNTEQGPTRTGNCRRYPPQLLMTLTPQGPRPIALFPVTVALSSCGEFQGRSLIES